MTDGILLNILTDDRWQISAHCRDNRGESYARKQIENWRHDRPEFVERGERGESEKSHEPNIRDMARSLIKVHSEPIIRLNDEYHFWRAGAYTPRKMIPSAKRLTIFLRTSVRSPRPLSSVRC